MNELLEALKGFGSWSAKQLLVGAAKESVERMALSAMELECGSGSWAKLGEGDRDIWRRRIGNVLAVFAREGGMAAVAAGVVKKAKGKKR